MLNKKYTTLIVLCALLAAAAPAQAGNAYRYFMLYKNSEIYKERHPEQDQEKNAAEDRRPKYDGWGNLVDPPPPPPPDKDEKEDYDRNYQNERRSVYEPD